MAARPDQVDTAGVEDASYPTYCGPVLNLPGDNWMTHPVGNDNDDDNADRWRNHDGRS